MKKITALLLAVAMCCTAFVGCGDKNDGDGKKSSSKKDGKELVEQLKNDAKKELYMEIADDGKGDDAASGTLAYADNGKKLAMNIETSGQKMKIILKDNTTYIINDEEKQYMKMDGADDSIKTEDLFSDDFKFEKSEVEKVDGKELTKVTYAGGDTKEFYYFDGDKLVKIDEENDGKKSTTTIKKISTKVPAGTFDIPEGYKEVDLSSLAGGSTED